MVESRAVLQGIFDLHELKLVAPLVKPLSQVFFGAARKLILLVEWAVLLSIKVLVSCDESKNLLDQKAVAEGCIIDQLSR